MITNLAAQGKQLVAKSLDDDQAAAHRRDARGVHRQQVDRLRLEAQPHAFEPCQGGRHRGGENRNDLRIRQRMRLHIRRPVRRLVAERRQHIGIDVPAGIVGEMLFEVVRHRRVVLHPHVRLGPARVAAEMLLARTFEIDHRQPLFECGDGRRQSGDAAPDDDQVGVQLVLPIAS